MADYNLGTARGKIVIDSSGAVVGMQKASGAASGAKKSLSETSSSFMGAGKSFALAGGAIVGAFGFAIKTAGDFEKRISAIAAVSGATGPEIDSLRKKALQLGADTAFSASESASAMEELVKAGVSVPDVLNGAADATVALAAAGEIALPEAASIAANAMNQFSLSAKEMPHIADLIAGAANASSIDVSDFGMSLSQVGAVAKLAGLSFDDTALAITAMGNAGIKGSDAGTSLKSMLAHLQPQSKRATDAMRELGVITEDGTNKFFDQTGKLKSLAEMSQILQDGTKGMTNQQKLANLQIAFGTDGIRAATIVAGEGADGFNKLADQMGKISAADVAAKRMDNLSGSVEQFTGSVETVLIQVGEIFQPVLRGIIDFATGIVNSFSNINPTVLKFIVIIVGVVGALLLAFGAFLIVAGGVMKLFATFQALQALLAANPIVLIIGAIIALIAILAIAYLKVKVFRDIINGMVSGIVDLFRPLAEIVVPFFQNLVKQVQNLFNMFKSGQGSSQGFAEILDNIFGNTGKLIPIFRGLYDAVAKVFNWIKGTAVPIISRFVERIGGVKTVLKIIGIAIAAVVAPFLTLGAALVYAYKNFEGFRNVVNSVARVVGGVLKSVFGWLASVLPTVGKAIVAVAKFFVYLAKEIVERLQSAFKWIQKNVFPVLSAFASLVAAVVGLIISIWKKLWPVFEFVGKMLLAVLVPIFKIAFGIIRTAITVFVNIVQAIWSAFGSKLWNIIKIAWDLIRGVVEGALRIIKGIINLVTGIIHGDWSQIWNSIKDIFSGVWRIIQSVLKAAIGVIGNVISGALALIKAIWSGAWNTVKSVLSAVWNGIKSAVSTSINAVIGFVRALPGRAVGALGAIASTLYNKGKDLINGLWNGAKNIWGSVTGWLGGLPGKVLSGVGNLANCLYDIGKKIINGLWNGMKNAFGAVGGWLGGLGGKITNLKGPPSYDKVMLVQNGKLIMQSLLDGMKSMEPLLESQLGGLSANMAAMTPSSYPSAGGGSPVYVALHFDGNFGPGSEGQIRSMLSDSSVLRAITDAAKAGVGAAR